MNKNITIAIGAALILALGAGAYFMLSNRTASTSDSPSISSDTQKTGTTAQQSLKDLLSAGRAQQCTFSDGQGTSGTVYAANNQMRGNFVYPAADAESTSNMIVDGSTMYMWVDGQPGGFKMAIDAANQPDSTDQPNQIDLDEKVDYECHNWTVDSSMFTVPTDIEFTDFGAFTLPSTTTGGYDATSQCAICDSLPSDSQAQCKTSLGCN